MGWKCTEMAQLTLIKWEEYWQKSCNYAEYGRVCIIMIHYSILEQLKRVHGYMSVLRRDEKARRFHCPVITFHGEANRFQAIPWAP